jgi:hypothetical protein
MTVILNKEQYLVLYKSSYIALLSVIYALYQKHYELVIVPTAVFITSINYWSKPDYSYRRYLDMAIVKSTMVYQIYIGYNAQYSGPFLCLWCLAGLSYLVAIGYYKSGDNWKSTYSHLIFHIFANIGNITLYSGYINGQTV